MDIETTQLIAKILPYWHWFILIPTGVWIIRKIITKMYPRSYERVQIKEMPSCYRASSVKQFYTYPVWCAHQLQEFTVLKVTRHCHGFLIGVYPIGDDRVGKERTFLHIGWVSYISSSQFITEKDLSPSRLEEFLRRRLGIDQLRSELSAPSSPVEE